jgi:hypothetical protein
MRCRADRSHVVGLPVGHEDRTDGVGHDQCGEVSVDGHVLSSDLLGPRHLLRIDLGRGQAGR